MAFRTSSLYRLYLKAHLSLGNAPSLHIEVEEERAGMELPERDEERFVNWVPIVVPLIALFMLALVFFIDFL
jgi:hypothetical protein